MRNSLIILTLILLISLASAPVSTISFEIGTEYTVELFLDRPQDSEEDSEWDHRDKPKREESDNGRKIEMDLSAKY